MDKLLRPGTMDANKYTASLGAIRDLLKDKDSSERFSAISTVSIVSMVPIIALVMIMIDMYGTEDRLYSLLKTLMIYYDTGVVTYKNESFLEFK